MLCPQKLLSAEDSIPHIMPVISGPVPTPNGRGAFSCTPAFPDNHFPSISWSAAWDGSSTSGCFLSLQPCQWLGALWLGQGPLDQDLFLPKINLRPQSTTCRLASSCLAPSWSWALAGHIGHPHQRLYGQWAVLYSCGNRLALEHVCVNPGRRFRGRTGDEGEKGGLPPTPAPSPMMM